MMSQKDDFLSQLPVNILGQIAVYLDSLAETRRFLLLNKQLHFQISEIESHRTFLQLIEPLDDQLLRHPTTKDAQSWMNMVSLDLGNRSENDILISVSRCMPALRRISMIGSPEVSRTGLRFLKRLKRLKYLDVTFCKNVVYEDVVKLRDVFHRADDVIIRRQPNWMDGSFETPFRNDGLHTYWPDGSFRYGREFMSIGFIHEVRLVETNPFHVQSLVQFSDFNPPADHGWPSWARFVYRPGVSLLWREPPQSHIERTLLVAQKMKGTRPPNDWPKTEHWSLPVGETFWFSKNGARTSEERGYVMVTRMRVRPLEVLFTPDEILQANRLFLQERNDFDIASENAFEEHLHRLLGGDL